MAGPGAWQTDSRLAWTPMPSVPPPPKRKHRAARAVLVVAVAVVSALIAAGVVGAILGKSDPGQPVTSGKWVTSTGLDGSFHVDFPGQAASGTKAGTPPQDFLAWPNEADAQYAVLNATFPPGTSIDVQGALNGAVNGIESGGAHISSTLDVPFHNNQARAISGTEKGAPFKALVFINGSNLYVLIAGGSNAVGQADRFFDSFALTG